MTFRWRGNAATDKAVWTNGLNWVDETGAAHIAADSPGSFATALDTAIFDEALAEGAASPLGAGPFERLAQLRVGPSYNGGIGAVGDPLVVQVSDGVISSPSAQGIFLEGATADGLDNVLHVITAPVLQLAGFWKRVRLFKGKITVPVGGEILDLLVSYIGNKNSDVNLNIAVGSVTGSPVWKIFAGQVVSSANLGGCRVYVYGGSFTDNGGDPSSVVISGGIYVWNKGSLPIAQIMGGKVDGSAGSEAREYGRAEIYEGGVFDIDNGLDNIIQDPSTQANGIYWYGGDLVVTSGVHLHVIH